MSSPLSLLLLVVLSELFGYGFCKECTNTPTQLSSHTFRYELLASGNKTWQAEMFNHYHLTPSDDSAWSGLFPRRMLREEEERNWALMYRKLKNSGGGGGSGGLLNEVSLHDVRLDPNSRHGEAQQTNLEYLLMLDVDSLVWSFRKNAGLETPGRPYGGWEAPNVELRGHFVGHYMSAAARMWASTHNDTLKKNMAAVVSALSACQEKLGTGYLSAFPTEFFDRFEAIKPVWAPYYTIHKILAGLLDQYTFAGDGQALKMAIGMADYFNKRVQNVIAKYTVKRHWQSLNEETGGMNDVLYNLYAVTGDKNHLMLAHLFDKPCFLGLLAVKADDIADFHANTHIPVVVGSQMRYEVTGDPLYKEIATFFMDIVNSSHSYATGGTSVSEFWYDPKRLASTLHTENEESCTTYNMLKVSRNLFRWTKETVYADYYERALTNGVLSIQRGREPGVMIYMLPLGHGTSKAFTYHKWGTPYDSFWCCYGTGIESFSKLGDSIYFEDGGKVPSLYIIQYISSSFNWRLAKISLNQEVEQVSSSDPRTRVTFKFSANEQEASAGEATLNLRMPVWTSSDGAKATLNGQNILVADPGKFLTVTRAWSPGDKLMLELPISLRTEAIKDDRPEFGSIKAILYGPYLLAGYTSGDWDIDAKSKSEWITPVPREFNSFVITLSQESSKQSTVVLTSSNSSLAMDSMPQPGTNAALAATFRLVPKEQGNFSGAGDALGKTVVLEPINFPGATVVHYGDGKNLGISSSSSSSTSPAAGFRMVPGLDGTKGSVSFESEEKKGCYFYNDGASVTLSCGGGSPDDGFRQGSSFRLRKGVSEYDPISFVARGVRRNFLVSPLMNLRDESYSVYFNFSN
ncbi:uncharacterized protein LOC127243017 [Andrographis paniculata]|uniref:uncharacterized protein LOC127243017 n=1 Tax=Andrographis paniculata TaxID=175694 RepID=UPI0021E962BE|nr:uncharacterized protein LOC127243017 [Andrographis paniculata]